MRGLGNGSEQNFDIPSPRNVQIWPHEIPVLVRGGRFHQITPPRGPATYGIWKSSSTSVCTLTERTTKSMDPGEPASRRHLHVPRCPSLENIRGARDVPVSQRVNMRGVFKLTNNASLWPFWKCPGCLSFGCVLRTEDGPTLRSSTPSGLQRRLRSVIAAAHNVPAH